MNSERRHDLQQNYLAQYVGNWIKLIEPHAKLIAVVFAVVVGVVVAFGLVQNSKTMARSDATLELLQNANGGDAEALATVGDRYASTIAGTMARLFEADTNLSAGITSLYADKEEGESKIEDALKAYREVTVSTQDRFLLSRAHLGIGHALESIGKAEDAIAAYRQAVAINESPALVAAAQQRIDLLQKPDTAEFLTWFAKQDFKPADPSLPPSLPDGKSLPALPDLDLPEIKPLEVPTELKNEAETAAAKTDDAPGEMKLPETPVETAPASAPDPGSTPPASTDSTPATEPTVAPAEGSPESPADINVEAPANPTPTESTSEPNLDNPTVRVTDEVE